MSITTLSTPTRSRFGTGARHQILDLFQETGSDSILVIASARTLQQETIKELIATLQTKGPVLFWDSIKPNPRTNDIDECQQRFADHKITHIVGIGGGSALDQAKAIAMALHCQMSIESLRGMKALPKRDNQLLLLPTTSGTGAELSFGAILTDTESGKKFGLRGENLAADAAIIDPELTWSVPKDISMVTGFDILTHGLETWISSAATPYTRDLSRGAIERVFTYLPQLFDDETNKTAREELAYASMIMGINLALSTTCLPHRLQYPIGAATDSAHAAGLAAIYPAWLDQLQKPAEQKLATCFDWVAPDEDRRNQLDPKHKAAHFSDAIQILMKRIQLTPSLKELGVTAKMLDDFTNQVDGRLDTDPSYHDHKGLEAIYRQSY